MLILGLDPGSIHTGYGLLEKEGPRLKARAQGRFSYARSAPLPVRLAGLIQDLDAFLEHHKPQTVVLETPFHGMNTRSLIVLAEVRGAILGLLGTRALDICEYSPAEVKSTLTGNGRADKGQVATMVRLLLSLDEQELASDVTDALALAICYAQRSRIDRLTNHGILVK